jgi:hypothetical protein
VEEWKNNLALSGAVGEVEAQYLGKPYINVENTLLARFDCIAPSDE